MPEKSRPAVIICPGGAYEFLSDRESDPVALRFASYGINAFVLKYRVPSAPFPTNLLEAAAAVAYVRSNAEKWSITPDNISICGFSAGGHLAASLAVHWHRDFVRTQLSGADCRPDKAILAYPVISSGKYAHKGSIRNIAGEKPSPELTELVSLEKHVSDKTPPVFIWHCSNDGTVPVQNSLLFASALSDCGIMYEAHIYPSGGHGISLADECTSRNPEQINPLCAQWFDSAVRFIKK